MGCSQTRSLVAIGVTMTILFLLACSQASASSSQQQQQHHHQNHMRKMLNAGASSPPQVRLYGCEEPQDLVTVSQNQDTSYKGGIPAYTVEIINNCVDCVVCDIHLSCGDFANTELVDPSTFRRLGHNDCLVNHGGPIAPGDMVIFQYSNSFLYQMKVASASCSCH